MIYFIQNIRTKAVKIGFSHGDPRKRLRTFQTGNHDALTLFGSIAGDRNREQELHARFDEFRIDPRREWFRGEPGLYDAVRSLIRDDSAPVIEGRAIRRVYLAGKITHHGWREDVLGFAPDNAECVEDVSGDDAWPEEGFRSGPREFLYVGPYFMANVHSDIHACGSHAWTKGAPCVSTAPALDAHDRCLDAVRRCDLVFAWIESADCHGSIAEIAYAAAMGKLIVISGPTFIRDLWFVYHFAGRIAFADQQRWSGPRMAMAEMLDPSSQCERFADWRAYIACGFHGDPLDKAHGFSGATP